MFENSTMIHLVLYFAHLLWVAVATSVMDNHTDSLLNKFLAEGVRLTAYTHLRRGPSQDAGLN